MKKLIAIGAATVLLTASAAVAKPGPQPRIAKADATRTALAAVPGGKVTAVELDTEHNQLIYSLDIAVPGRTGVEEVQVSAMTGKIVSRKHEGPLQEKLEQAAEKLAGH
jgi:uncharacterized membrane protein YkoI